MPYDEAVARQYASYRPPLHALILERALGPEHFTVGLDVGCGTGYSTIALVDYCDIVMGIDPSADMLQRATPHDGIQYKIGDAERIPLPDTSIDIATYAGSLSYADRGRAAKEIRRVCRDTVVVYDFSILLDELVAQIGDYDHSANFSGIEGFYEVMKKKERMTIDVTAPQLATLLGRPHAAAEMRDSTIDVDIYYARYDLT